MNVIKCDRCKELIDKKGQKWHRLFIAKGKLVIGVSIQAFNNSGGDYYDYCEKCIDEVLDVLGIEREETFL